MSSQTKFIDIELSQPVANITDLEGCQKLQGLLRFKDVPLGYIFLPVDRGTCSAESIVSESTANHDYAIASEVIRQSLKQECQPDWLAKNWLSAVLAVTTAKAAECPLPTLTAVICPRNADHAQLSACLKSLGTSARSPLEVIVVTADSDDDLTALQADFPYVKWLRTTDANRSIQRNLALQMARGEIVAFLDGTCCVDPKWVTALSVAFADSPEVAAITGLVVPQEIQSSSSAWFEQRYSLDRGFQRTWHRLDFTESIPWVELGTMWVGSGANMAFRRSLFETIGEFDPALDQANSTWAGADLEIFSRVLLSGKTLLYEPSAVVRHFLPETEAALQARITQDIAGFYAYLAAGWQQYPRLRWQFFTLGVWKLVHLLIDLGRPYGIPRRLIWAELMAAWQSWRCYPRVQRSIPCQVRQTSKPSWITLQKSAQGPNSEQFMAVRTVELNHPLPTLTDIQSYERVRIFVTAAGSPIGSVDIANTHQVISSSQLRQAIATNLATEILALAHGGNTQDAWSSWRTTLKTYLLPPLRPKAQPPSRPKLSDDVPVSIVITTCDRPNDLENCLTHLLAQKTQRPVEIVVADNHPISGITPKVIAKFPGVKLVQEPRPGGAYGRNAAIAASTGDIIVTIDDDVTTPPDWLEKLVAPLVRPEVMVVTGNVLPKELETPAQYLFEALKGGLSQGYQSFEADGSWLAASQNGLPPIWDLGVSANAAFRADIFCHSEIGLFDETLGPGTPTSGGEECYLFYRVLRAGYTVVYEPTAFAWHRHRREMKALYHQVYSHMKGGMAFMLRVWLQDHDKRAFRHLFRQMPGYLKQRLIDRALGRHDAPWLFIWQELRGFLDAFWCYRQSCQRVQQQGLSKPYVPVANRLQSPCLVAPNMDAAIVTPTAATSPTTSLRG